MRIAGLFAFWLVTLPVWAIDPNVRVEANRVVVSLPFNVDLEKWSAADSYAYVVVPATANTPLRLVQIRFAHSGTPVRLELSNLQCLTASGWQTVDLVRGLPSCGLPALGEHEQREVHLELSGLPAAGSGESISLSLSGSVAPAGAVLKPLNVLTGGNTIYFSVAGRARVAQLAQAFQRAQGDSGKLKVSLKFDPSDPMPPHDLRVVSASTNTETKLGGITALPGTYVKLQLSGRLPPRPRPYRVTVSLDKSVLPDDLRRLLPSDAGSFGVAALIKPEAGAPSRDNAVFFGDFTFTSYVSPSDPTSPFSRANSGVRRNVGLLSLEYRPVLKNWILAGIPAMRRTTETDPNPVLAPYPTLYWLSLRPFVAADVSTIPLRETGISKRITTGLDLEWGTQLARDSAGALQQIVVDFGGRHEADRDYKSQVAYAHFAVTPVVKGWEQTDEQRAASKPASRITSYYVRPTVAYDIGNIVRNHVGALDDFGKVSRFNAKLGMGLVFARYLTLSATDNYYRVLDVSRRPNRNYFEGKLAVNSNYLFGHYIFGGLQNAILLKFQRGEQPPVFSPVNVFSVGLTLTR